MSAATFNPEEKVEVADAVEVRTPVLLIEKRVEVADAVEEPIAKRLVAVEPLFAWTESFAYGDVVAIPMFPLAMVVPVPSRLVPKMRLPIFNTLSAVAVIESTS